MIPTEFYLGSLAACTSRSRLILKRLRWQRSLSAPLWAQATGETAQHVTHAAQKSSLPPPSARRCSHFTEKGNEVPGLHARHGENPRWRGRHVAFLQAFPAPGAGEGGSPPRGPRTPRFPSSSALPANRGLVSGRLDTGHEPLRRSLIIIFRPHVFFPKPRLAKGSSD